MKQDVLTVELLELATVQMFGGQSIVDAVKAEQANTIASPRNQEFKVPSSSFEAAKNCTFATSMAFAALTMISKHNDPSATELILRALIARSIILGAHAQRNMVEKASSLII